MPSDQNNIYWLLQKNITNQDEYEQLKAACIAAGTGVEEITIIPFTESLPPFDRTRRCIVYGSITLSKLAAKDPDLKKGVFADDINFSMENYLSRWGKHMLNYGAKLMTLEELVQSGMADDKELFIRPDDDNKSFAGEVKTFRELKQWFSQLKDADRTDLSHQEKLLVAEPWNILYEWRCWIVNKKVVAASQYRENFRLKKVAGCPDTVKEFAESRSIEYTPHDIFVMDICLCGDAYYIVECGSMNATGFYHASINDIVAAVTAYFTSEQ